MVVYPSTMGRKFRWSMPMIYLGIIVLLCALFLTGGGAGETITVDDDGGADFERIQDALNVSQDGDTIRVFAGTYREYIYLNKSVSLIGNGSETTSIIPSVDHHIISISSGNVTVAGFYILNQFDSHRSGVSIESNNVTIIDNRISVFGSGITTRYSENVTISDNEIFVRWYGIVSQDSSQISIENNVIMNCNGGINLIYSNNSIIRANIIRNNNDGVFIISSNDCVIGSNLFSENGNGIYIWYLFEPPSFNITIHANHFVRNLKFAIHSKGYSNDTFDGRDNWWGDVSGPFHKTLNPNGSGENITEGLRFIPWLTEDDISIYVDDDALSGGDGSRLYPYNRIPCVFG